jgi:1,4-alpha-glucan branching enzyme
MSRRHFSFFLHGHLPWVLGHGRWPHGAEWLAEAAVETWIPLLRALERLRQDGLRGGVTLSVSPVLAEQLGHERFRTLLDDYLADRERTASLDARREWPDEAGRQELAGWWRRFYREERRFLEAIDGDLLGELRSLADSGVVELATCGATHHYFPLLARDESIALQTELAVRVHERHFGRRPDGIWLPECGYRPAGIWHGRSGQARERVGVEEIVARSGLSWFVVDSALVTGGRALGSYPDRTHDLRGAREAARAGNAERPVRPGGDTRYSYRVASPGTASRVLCFARDPGTGLQVWSGERGYPGDPAYLDFHKKSDTGGHRYWRVTGPGVDLGDKEAYSPEEAAKRVESHAHHFSELVAATLAGTDDGAILCAPYDAELFGHWWFEGVDWIEGTLRRLRERDDVILTTLSRHAREYPPRSVMALPEGSWGEGGGHAVWSNPHVDWTWDLVDPAEEEVWDLVARSHDAPPLARRFALGAVREFLLLGASDWAFLVTTNGAPDYAAERVRTHADDVARLAEATRRLLDGQEPRPDDLAALEEIESRDDLFPELEEAVAAAERVAREAAGAGA